MLSAIDLSPAARCDPERAAAAQHHNLIRLLEVRGATTDEIVEANNAGRLTRLAGEILFLPTGERFGAEEAAERAGVPVQRLRHLWQIAGLSHAGESDQRFTEGDVAWVRTLTAAATLLGEGPTVQLLRAISAAAASIADATVSTFISTAGTAAIAAGVESDQFAEVNADAAALVPGLLQLVEGLLRQHLVDAARPNLTGDDTSGTETALIAVGFVDLVGSTELAQRLPLTEVADAIAAFENIAADTVHRWGGRVVKFIGDEVMYTATDPAVACAIAVDTIDQLRRLPDPAHARAGVAFGEVLVRAADRFGPVVNLAARATKAALPGSVLATAAAAEAAGELSNQLDFRTAGHCRLHGFTEAIELIAVTRASCSYVLASESGPEIVERGTESRVTHLTT